MLERPVPTRGCRRDVPDPSTVLTADRTARGLLPGPHAPRPARHLPRRRARGGGGRRRSQRLRQVHPARRSPRPGSRLARLGQRRRCRSGRPRPRRLAGPGGLGPATAPPLRPLHRRQRPPRPTRRHRSTRFGPPSTDAGLDDVVAALPAGTRHHARRPRAPGCRPGSASGWPWRGPSCAMRPLLLLDEPTANLDGADRGGRAGRRAAPDGRSHRRDRGPPALPCWPWPTGSSDWHARRGGGGVVTAPAPTSRAGELAPVGRTLAIARPARGRLALAALLGAGAIAADIGLMGTAAWLISRAAQHPNEATLALAIVGVQFFGLSRGLPPLRGAPGRPRRRLPTARRPAGAGLRAARAAGARRACPRSGGATCWPAWSSDVDSLQDVVLRVDPALRHRPGGGRRAPSPCMWWMLPAAGADPGRVPGPGGHRRAVAHRSAWRSARESRFAAVRGDLGAAMVDLIEGAAELIAFGAADAQLRTIAEPGRRTDRHRLGLGRDRGHRAGPDDRSWPGWPAGAASWSASPPCCRVGSAATELAVITLIPLAAFELVVGLPVATQALQRVRQAAARVFEVTRRPGARDRSRARPSRSRRPALRPRGAVGVGRLPGCRPAGSARRGPRPSPGRRVAVVGPSGAGKSTLAAVLRRLPALPRPAPSRWTACRSDQLVRRRPAHGGRAWSTRTPTSSTPPWPRTCASGGATPPTTSCATCSTGSGLAAWLDELPGGLATEVGPHGARLSGGQRQRVAVARALLADFPVLVLDEPAEHLDPAAADALTADLLDVTDGTLTRPHHPPPGRTRVRRRDPGHGRTAGWSNGAPTTNCSARPGATPTSGGRR